jgi:uncharacterized protein YecE (DUF72 family)
VPAGFKFSVKAPRTITHEALLSCSSEMLSAFLGQVGFLRDKLGPILFQLPPRLEFTLARTRQFLSLLRDHYFGEVVLEPRHASWFGVEADELLREFHVARVAADPACAASAASPGGWASLVYFRLHGSPRRYYSAYTEDYLNILAAQMADLAGKARIWCVFDNTASGAAVPNALTLREKVGGLVRS